MDDSFLIVLVIGFVISIPVVAIIALVRTGTLRRRLEENYQEFRDKFTDLTGEGRWNPQLFRLFLFSSFPSLPLRRRQSGRGQGGPSSQGEPSH